MWTFRVDGWGDPIATWRKNVIAKLDAGQSEGELSNDLLLGARLLERAAAGVSRQMRYPLIEAADRLREPGDPFYRAGAALAADVTELLDAVSAARIGHPRRAARRLGGSAAGAVQFLVRDVPAVHRAAGTARATPCTAPSPRPPRRCPGSPGWASTSSTCPRSIRSARCTARAATTASPPHPTTSARRGRSAATRAATTRCTRIWAPSRTSTTSSPPPATKASRWPSTWRCSARPDHPWARDHPEWFTVLPDGTIAYAENPPKKYQDIYPMNFDNDPAGLYEEVLRVVEFWISHGVKIFRVDNPHTKPPNFWAWLIGEVKNDRPRRAVPGRGLHPAGAAVRSGETRLHAVLHVLHLAHGQVGADRVRRAIAEHADYSPARACGSTPRTSCTKACSTAARGCSRSVRCWPRR